MKTKGLDWTVTYVIDAPRGVIAFNVFRKTGIKFVSMTEKGVKDSELIAFLKDSPTGLNESLIDDERLLYNKASFEMSFEFYDDRFGFVTLTDLCKFFCDRLKSVDIVKLTHLFRFSLDSFSENHLGENLRHTIETDSKTTHILKTWPEYFQAALCGDKRFELRNNDRNFRSGDKVILQEFDRKEAKITGREKTFYIGYVLSGIEGLDDNYVCFTLNEPAQSGEAQ